MTIEMLEKKYPKGTRVKYTGSTPMYTIGCEAVKLGDKGTVLGVNSWGDLNVMWDNGYYIALEIGVNPFSVLYRE